MDWQHRLAELVAALIQPLAQRGILHMLVLVAAAACLALATVIVLQARRHRSVKRELSAATESGGPAGSGHRPS